MKRLIACALVVVACTAVVRSQESTVAVNFTDVQQRIDGFGAADPFNPRLSDAHADRSSARRPGSACLSCVWGSIPAATICRPIPTRPNSLNLAQQPAVAVVGDRFAATLRASSVISFVGRATPVSGVPEITSAVTASGAVDSAFAHQVTATNTPTSYDVTGLPAGLIMNAATGLITGTPTAVGVSTVTLSATSNGGTSTATLTLTIAPK